MIITLLSFAEYGIFTLYLFCGIIIFFGLKKYNQSPLTQFSSVSVIVAARNEEHYISACLNSLTELDYPQDKLELIIVDDHSTDKTLKIIKEFADIHKHIIPIALGDYFENNSGKADAIQFAVEKSKGEFLFVTDADCQVPRGWIKNLLSAFTPGMGLVGGATLLDKPNEKMPLFGRIQSFDWLYLLTIALSTGHYGFPISWFGNNMAFRRETFDSIGGFKNLRNTIVEDFAFILKIHKSRNWKIKFLFHQDSLVKSDPVLHIRSYYNQRKRWASAVNAVHPVAKLMMFTSVAAHVIIVLNIITLQFHSAIWGFTIMTLVDLTATWKSTGFLDRRDLLKYILPFKIYYFYFTLVFPVMLIFDHKIDWKDRNYPIFSKTTES